MKRIILCLFSAILFYSCDVAQGVMDIGQDIYSNLQLGYSQVYYISEFEQLDTPLKIYQYLDASLIYEKGDAYPTESVEEILNNGKTNCRGFSKAFANIMYVSTGYKCNIIILDMDDRRKIANGGRINHCLIEYKNRLYEPQTGEAVEYNCIGYKYSFDDVFYY